jgi:hypothetical protein
MTFFPSGLAAPCKRNPRRFNRVSSSTAIVFVDALSLGPDIRDTAVSRPPQVFDTRLKASSALFVSSTRFDSTSTSRRQGQMGAELTTTLH